MKEFYESFKKSKWFPLVIGVASFILGILFLANPSREMKNNALFIGIAILVYGVLVILAGLKNRASKKAFATNMVVGAACVVAAVAVFANLELIGKYLPTLFGFLMILTGLRDLISSVALLKSGLKNWWLAALPAVVVLVLGFIFLLAPGFVGKSFGIFTGITLLVNGVSSLINFTQFK